MQTVQVSLVEMPQRELLGLSPGGLQGPLIAPGSFPVNKPLRRITGQYLPFFRGSEKSRLPEPAALPVDPVYLFYCYLNWQKTGDTTSGWELAQAIRRGDRVTRAFAAKLFSGTEGGRLLVRDLRRIRGRLDQISRPGEEPGDDVPSMKGERMNTPYGLELVENCLTCKLRREGWFCSFSREPMKLFAAIGHLTTYPGGAILFVEGQRARGAFVLCSGKVKLTTTSREGKILIMKIVEPGEIMGLSAVFSEETYAVSAETVGPCLINFLEHDALIRLLANNSEMGLHAAQALSREYQSTYRDIHELVLSRSSSGKLARLLLSWVSSRKNGDGQEWRIQAPATHEEMAQRIGASRETVTRLLSDLRKREMIRLEGSTLIITNRSALETLAM